MFHMRWLDSTEVGPRTVGCAWRLVALFSFAHGGKDRHPFPVPLRVYDETIRVLKSAIRHAKLGQNERLGALKRLDDQARRLEQLASGSSVPALIALERQRSACYGGRSVLGWEPTTLRRRSGTSRIDEPQPQSV